MKAADLLVSEGYEDLGYEYVIVDDCWLAKNRSADGNLEADKKRFPSGIKALSNYVSIMLQPAFHNSCAVDSSHSKASISTYTNCGKCFVASAHL